MKLVDKINISEIVKNHFSTLVNHNTKKAGLSDYFTFLIIPLLVSSLMCYFKADLTGDSINIIIVSLSIFIGLFFNVILLIFDIIHRDATKKLKNELLKQLLSNIAFTVFLAITIIVFALVSLVKYPCIKIASEASVYFLLTVFLVTALMILKRLYKLFNTEIGEIAEKESQG